MNPDKSRGAPPRVKEIEIQIRNENFTQFDNTDLNPHMKKYMEVHAE